MKKLFGLILALSLIVVIEGCSKCGAKENQPESSSQNTPSNPAPSNPNNTPPQEQQQPPNTQASRATCTGTYDNGSGGRLVFNSNNTCQMINNNVNPPFVAACTYSVSDSNVSITAQGNTSTGGRFTADCNSFSIGGDTYSKR